jgi:hypothetical protein
MTYITFCCIIDGTLFIGPETAWMEDVNKKQALEDEHPTLGDVQGIVSGEVRVKHRIKEKCPHQGNGHGMLNARRGEK